MSLTYEQRRDAIAQVGREIYDQRRQDGVATTYDACHQRAQQAAVRGDNKREGK